MADPDTWHGLKENPATRLYASLVPDAYGPLIEKALRDSWTAEQFQTRMGVKRKPLTRRQRVKRWWARNWLTVHRGPCNHDDCY